MMNRDIEFKTGTDVEKLIAEQERINRKIKTRKLPKYKVESIGGVKHNDEVFVSQTNKPDYYVSQYGRVVSTKFSKPKLLKIQTKDKGDKTKYQYYGAMIKRQGKKKMTHMALHRAVALEFSPNLYKGLKDEKGKQIPIEVHHLNHKEWDNRAVNLVWLPKDLHLLCNGIGKFGLWRNKNARNLHPLDIVAKTGLDLRDIITAVYQEPIKKVGKWTIYDVKGYRIALELLSTFGNKGFLKNKKSA